VCIGRDGHKAIATLREEAGAQAADHGPRVEAYAERTSSTALALICD
jgi:hypothetical protein